MLGVMDASLIKAGPVSPTHTPQPHSPHPASWSRQTQPSQVRKLLGHCLEGCLPPASWRGWGDKTGNQSIQDAGMQGRAGQRKEKVRCCHSQIRQGVCAVFAIRAGKYVRWRL